MNRKLLFILANIYLVVSTIIVSYCTLAFGTIAGQVDTGVNYGAFYLATFTVESNLLLGVTALLSLIYATRHYRDKTKFSKQLTTLYLVSSSLVMLTFITVVTFLAPIRAFSGRNYFDMLVGPMFFFHFFNPVISALVYIFLIDGPNSRFARLLTLLPLSIYAVLYLVNIIILHNWDDFYHFTFDGRYYFTFLAFIIIFSVTFSIASLLSFFRQKFLQSQKTHA